MVLGLVLRVSLATPSTAAKTPPACGVAGLRCVSGQETQTML